MKPLILVCSVVALFAGLYLLMAVTGAEPQSISRSETPHVIPVPAGPIVMNRREQPRLLAGIERSTSGPGDVKDAEDQSPPRPPTGDEMRAQIEGAFASDTSIAPSMDRAPDLENRVRAVIPPGSSVRSLECRSSLCRIETMHPSLEDFQNFVQRGYLSLDFATRVSSGPVFVALLTPAVEGQPVVGVAFLGRDGSVLPTFTPVASAGWPPLR